MNKKAKGLLALILALMLAFSLAACGGESATESTEGTESDEHYTIGIVQLIDNGAFTDMREGSSKDSEKKASQRTSAISLSETHRAIPQQ
jgi:putative ABC transport system substrate-binding protein